LEPQVERKKEHGVVIQHNLQPGMY